MTTPTSESAMEFTTTVQEFPKQVERLQLAPTLTIKVIVGELQGEIASATQSVQYSVPVLPVVPYEERMRILNSMPKNKDLEDAESTIRMIRHARLNAPARPNLNE